MKYILIYILFFASAMALGSGQEVQVLKGQPVFLEFHIKDAAEPPTVLVTEQQTGKKALVVLKKQPGHEDIWYSFLVIRLGDDLPGPQVLQFQTRTGETLIAHSYQTLKGKHDSMAVTLFTDQQAHDDFAKQYEVRAKDEEIHRANALQKNAKSKEDLLLGSEALEALKRERMMQEQEKLSAEDKMKRKAMAVKVAKQASAMYAKGQFKKAESLYSKAKELDPENDSFYFQHGISLYKLGMYTQSLSVLALAEGGDLNQAEYDYYIALNHMKLKEFDRALEEFKEIQDEKDPNFSPIAAFFAGSIEYQFKKYTDAKASFEFVMENTKDPQLDKEAEKMVEEIDRIETFLAASKEVLRYSFNFGLGYDGNILNLPAQNAATDKDGYRSNYGLTLLLRMYHSMTQELSFQALYSDMYSVDTSFTPDATLQSADPQTLQASIPYKLTLSSQKKTYVINLVPSYSILNMDVTGDGRETITKTSGVASDISMSFAADWVASFKVEYVQEDSLLEATTENEDQSGTRGTIGTTQTKLLGLDGKQSLSVDFSYADNVANGKDNTYKQSTIGLTYGFPSFWSASAALRADYTTKDYPDATVLRNDKSINYTYSQYHDVSKTLTLSWALQFNENTSNLSLYTYDKVVANIGLVYTGAFSRD